MQKILGKGNTYLSKSRLDSNQESWRKMLPILSKNRIGKETDPRLGNQETLRKRRLGNFYYQFGCQLDSLYLMRTKREYYDKRARKIFEK